MKDHFQLAQRGEQAEREACRLIGAVLDTAACIRVPARAALSRLPKDLGDIGGLPQLALELVRRYRAAETPEDVVTVAVRAGIDAPALTLASFLVECNNSPACQPEDAVQVIEHFVKYVRQLRAIEALETKAWQGIDLHLSEPSSVLNLERVTRCESVAQKNAPRAVTGNHRDAQGTET